MPWLVGLIFTYQPPIELGDCDETIQKRKA